MRFTCTSNIVIGIDGHAGAFWIRVASFCLRACFTSRQLARKSGDLRRSGSSFRSSSSWVIQPSPILLVIRCDKLGVAQRKPTARRDAIGHVEEFLRTKLVEVVQHGFLQQLECRAATPFTACEPTVARLAMRTYFWPCLVDERNSREAGIVVGELGANFVEEAAIDLVDDLRVRGSRLAKSGNGHFSSASGSSV